jgi:hypothetical protein
MNFTEYRNHFTKQLSWVSDQKIEAFSKLGRRSQPIIACLDEYERDLHVACRHIDLLLKYYPNKEKIPPKAERAAESLCFKVRFTLKDKLDEALKNVRT